MLKNDYRIRAESVWSFWSFKKFFVGFSGYYHNNLKLYDSFPIFVLLVIFSILIAIFRGISEVFAFAISIVCFISFHYFSLKRQVIQFRLKREFEGPKYENEEVTIKYTIYNPSSYKLSRAQFTDFFSGTSQNIEFIISEIPANTKVIKRVKVKLDMGMGEKFFRPLVTKLEDPIGLFTYYLEYIKEQTLMVLPSVEKVEFKNEIPHPESLNTGLFNSPMRGYSTNFIGTKEYVQGEPIKRVNWKLSLKEQKIILNEYEKDSNANCLIIPDFDKIKHFGKGSLSTWEYVKDISLSIANSYIEKGNGVSVLSQEYYIPLNIGFSHLEYIEYIVSNCHLSENSQLIQDLPYDNRLGNVFYITSFVQFLRSAELLEKLYKLSLTKKVMIVFVDPFDYYLIQDKNDHHVMLQSLFEVTQEKLLPKLKSMIYSNFDYRVVKINQEHTYRNQLHNRGLDDR